jgi:hypothetical protein
MTNDVERWIVELAEADERVASSAAEALLHSPKSLLGEPPAQLLSAVMSPIGLPTASILNLARAWSRPEMSRATLDALRRAADLRERERLAWLLKTVLAAEHGREAIKWVMDDAENDEVRRWIFEAIERLVFGGHLGWDELADVVTMAAGSRHATLRAALSALLTALPWRSANIHLLEPLLNDADPDVVSAAAHTLAGHPDAVRQLQPRTLEELRRHTNPRIRHGAAELDASLRRQ